MQNNRAALLPGKFFALEFVNFIFKRLYGDFAAALCHSCDQMRSDLLNLGRYEFVYPNELYCVEFAFCCAYSAADALLFVQARQIDNGVAYADRTEFTRTFTGVARDRLDAFDHSDRALGETFVGRDPVELLQLLPGGISVL